MPRRRDDIKAQEMTALYSAGFSLAQVAVAFGVSRQAVFKMLKRRGVAMRTAEPLPFITYQGRRYTIRNTGYYAATSGDRELLHRNVWKDERGPIPEGYEVHHKDGNKMNNTIENLTLLTSEEHGRAHGFGGNQYTGSLGSRPVR